MCGTEIYEYYTASILSTDEKVVRKKKKKTQMRNISKTEV
jgi:hypothetical protein